MSDQLSVLGLAIDSSGAASGAQSWARSIDSVSRKAMEAESAQQRLGGSFNAVAEQMRRSMGVLAAGFGMRQLIAYTDEWKGLTSQLGLVTDSSAHLARTQRDLFDLAQETRTGLSATTELYARLARSTEQLQLGDEKLLQVTESVNKAVIISGVSAASSGAALVQFAQGLAVGALRAEELRSVMEQTPRLSQAIAEGMGVSIGQLKTLGEQGALTTEKLAAAMISQASVLDEEFSRMQIRVSEGFTLLRNSTLRYIGEADQARGVSGQLAAALGFLARNFETVADTAMAAAAIWGARAIAPMVAGTMQFISAQGQMRMAVMQGEAVMLGSARAAAMQAEFSLASARAFEIETQAAVRQAAVFAANARLRVANTLADQASLAERGAALNVLRLREAELAAAQAASAAAAGGSTAAYTALTAAQARLTLGSRVATVAMTGFNRALAFVGGPWGAAILGIGAAYMYLSSRATAAEEAEKQIGERLVENGGASRGYAAALERLAKLKPELKIETADSLQQVKDLEAAVKALQEVGRGGFFKSADRDVFDRVMQNYKAELIAGRVTAEQFGDQVGMLQGEFSHLSREAADAIEKAKYWANQIEAARSGAKALGNAAEKTAAQLQQMGTAMVATLDPLARQVESQRRLTNALQTGGVAALELETVRQKGAKTWDAYRAASKQSELATVDFNAALKRQIPMAVTINSLNVEAAQLEESREKNLRALEDAQKDGTRAAEKAADKMREMLDAGVKLNAEIEQSALNFRQQQDALRQSPAAYDAVIKAQERERDIRRAVADLAPAERAQAAEKLRALDKQKDAVEALRIEQERLAAWDKRMLELRKQEESAALTKKLDAGMTQLAVNLQNDPRFIGMMNAQAMSDAWRGAIDQIGQDFQRLFANGFAGWQDFFHSVSDLARQTAAQIAAAMTVKALGIDKLIKEMTSTTVGAGWTVGGGFTGPKAFGKNVIAGFGGGMLGGQFGAEYGNNGLQGGLMGGLTGAAAGLAMGGPVGAIVGGVTGLVTGLLGAGQKAEEAAQRMREARELFETNLKAFTDAAYGRATDASRAQEEAIRAGRELQQQAIATVTPWNGKDADDFLRFQRELSLALMEVNMATAAMIATLQQEALVRSQRRTEDLELGVMQQQARGLGDKESAQMRRAIEDRERQLRHEREMADARKELWTQEQIDLLARNHAEEELAIQRERQIATLEALVEAERKAQEIAKEGRAFMVDLAMEEAARSGDIEQIRYAQLAALQLEQDMRREAGRKLVESGAITEAEFERFNQLLGNQFTDAVNSTAYAVEAAARQMQSALSLLNQEFAVFETDLAGQLQQTGQLFGFAGMSPDQLRDMFTTYGESGGNLTPEQALLNDQITQYLALEKRYRESQVATEDVAASTTPGRSTAQRTTNNGTVVNGDYITQISVEVHLDPEKFRNAQEYAEAVSSRVQRDIAGKISLEKGAAGYR